MFLICNTLYAGERIARAALAIGYGDEEVAYTGPVVNDCEVDYDEQVLLLMMENSSAVLRDEKIVIDYDFGFQVQVNGTFGGWNNVSTLKVEDNSVITLDISGVMQLMERDGFADEGERVQMTAVRYAWKDNVGCWQPYYNYSWTPYDDENFNCSQANYSIYAQPSRLPMLPFVYEIDANGHCLIQFNATSV